MKQQPETKENVTVENFIVHYVLGFKRLCLITVAFPLLALVVCLVTAYIFQSDQIHETHCRVYNIIPSISAITGISPQRYLWRISVAFHIGPRFIIAAVHRAYRLNMVNGNSTVARRAQFWLSLTFWLNIVEIGSLCGVTYISNRENYPIHEKLFVVFMTSSLLHMLACIKSIRYVAESNNSYKEVEKALNIKKYLLALSLASTIGLVGFFLKHRYLCHDMAFSWFAFCEYVVALANMAFHVTVIMDFPTEELVVARRLKCLNKLE